MPTQCMFRRVLGCVSSPTTYANFSAHTCSIKYTAFRMSFSTLFPLQSVSTSQLLPTAYIAEGSAASFEIKAAAQPVSAFTDMKQSAQVTSSSGQEVPHGPGFHILREAILQDASQSGSSYPANQALHSSSDQVTSSMFTVNHGSLHCTTNKLSQHKSRQEGQAAVGLHDASINNSNIFPHTVFGASTEERRVIEKFLNNFGNPAKHEWEALWYHNVASSFRNISHFYPQIFILPQNNSVTQAISEPDLNLSDLDSRDRTLFEDDISGHKPTFAPKSPQERERRQQKASQARNANEQVALLLGLPTFEDYIAEKSQSQPLSHCNVAPISKRQVKRQDKLQRKTEQKKARKCSEALEAPSDEGYYSGDGNSGHFWKQSSKGVMSSEVPSTKSTEKLPRSSAEHRPLVVGLTKPKSAAQRTNMSSSEQAAALNKEIEINVKSNVEAAGPAEDNPTAPPTQKPKKEKAPKQPKQPKGGAAAPPAPTSPALIDLRVGHILRAVAHPNADSLYVSTIAMGDPEGTEHTQVDEETGKIVRTVCSGLRGLIPLEDMQDRKIVVVANLKPVNMRSIKSAAMVLAASPRVAEGEDDHAADRTVELVEPPAASEAGDKVYFEGWSYGEGKGPEKQLNPKKKQWEAIQPGFYTTDSLEVAFDAVKCEEVEGDQKGNLVVEGKGVCKVKTLKNAVVR